MLDNNRIETTDWFNTVITPVEAQFILLITGTIVFVFVYCAIRLIIDNWK